MINVLICVMLALMLIYISKFLINVKEGMRRSREERRESRSEKKEARSKKKEEKKEARSEKKEEKKEARSEKKEEKKEARSEKKEARAEKKEEKKEARAEKKEEKKEARAEKKEEKKEAREERKEEREGYKSRNYTTSDEQDVLSDQLCTQISKNQFSDDDIDVANLSKVIEELKKEEKINNANKDTLLKYIQHIRVLKLRINNEILYKTKFSDVFNFSDDNDGTDQDIVSVLSNVDSAIKKKTDVINQLNILEKSLIDHYNYHKKLLDK